MRVKSSSLPAVAFLLVFLMAQGAVEAQSGRRNPKGSPSPPAPPTQTEQAPPTPQARIPAQPQIPLLVLIDVSQNLYFAIPLPERVQTWVANRLRESSALSVMEGDGANRSEAIKRAKASKETFVIFLQLEESAASPVISRQGRPNLDDVRIGYTIFAPVTGKAQSSGVFYMNQESSIIGIGRGRTLPVCYPGVRGNDLLLLKGSLEVASRIMSALNVTAPPVCQ
jgi:hypothetical protein